jgi:hypothetical protein
MTSANRSEGTATSRPKNSGTTAVPFHHENHAHCLRQRQQAGGGFSISIRGQGSAPRRASIQTRRFTRLRCSRPRRTPPSRQRRNGNRRGRRSHRVRSSLRPLPGPATSRHRRIFVNLGLQRHDPHDELRPVEGEIAVRVGGAGHHRALRRAAGGLVGQFGDAGDGEDLARPDAIDRRRADRCRKSSRRISGTASATDRRSSPLTVRRNCLAAPIGVRVCFSPRAE